jgi:hypothetical protein
VVITKIIDLIGFTFLLQPDRVCVILLNSSKKPIYHNNARPYSGDALRGKRMCPDFFWRISLPTTSQIWLKITLKKNVIHKTCAELDNSPYRSPLRIYPHPTSKTAELDAKLNLLKSQPVLYMSFQIDAQQLKEHFGSHAKKIPHNHLLNPSSFIFCNRSRARIRLRRNIDLKFSLPIKTPLITTCG